MMDREIAGRRHLECAGQRITAKMPRAWRHLLLFSLFALPVLAGLTAAGQAIAQNKAGPPVANPAPELAIPTGENTLILIRSALLSLNDGLVTGNYTVLRDLAAPSFRDANSAGQLYQIFANLAAQRLDLARVAILAPTLPQAPGIDQNRRLHISGYFQGEPIQLNFDLIFEPVGGHWRLFGISVVPVKSASANVTPLAGQAEASKKPLPQKGKAKERSQ